MAYLEPIERLESRVESSRIALLAAQDRDVANSLANPRQHVHAPPGNAQERSDLRKAILTVTDKLASRRALLGM